MNTIKQKSEWIDKKIKIRYYIHLWEITDNCQSAQAKIYETKVRKKPTRLMMMIWLI